MEIARKLFTYFVYGAGFILAVLAAAALVVGIGTFIFLHASIWLIAAIVFVPVAVLFGWVIIEKTDHT